MENYRTFSATVELIGTDWRNASVSSDTWRATGKAGEMAGEAAGYLVTCGPVNAFAKPSTLDASVPPTPRAAHEKIASDLAHCLNLPVPPVILYGWSTPPAGNQPNVSLSLVPFTSVHKWGAAATVPDLASQLKPQLIRPASAMVAFDTWLDNRDRQNDGNVLISAADSGSISSVCVAYIDYSYSMLYGWRGGHSTINPANIYPCDVAMLNKGVVADVVTRIEALPEDTIRGIVSRVPASFLQPDDQIALLEALLYRRVHLRAAMTAMIEVS